ncbi:MAG TPA: succinylglutamate desuccinylase/aspartoacylase family protein [Candidatus Egerieimonas intestinavium]|uniref:Succinylglutamate desuccinylase/aspartoacylase family protein n=1 Tax=Candidatus Egerieimonas intestinavium TaxID=2840777 RepID=A0A9D1EKB7_9FIRM|nr:succinylglutamate desuccinylase/aspartoacylase family protein [Candidatus Egerieimonas intestinavium]
MWTICKETLGPGEKRQVMLEPGVEGYQVPATLVCGAKPGKTLLVTAGIHAGEYPGVAAVIRMAAEMDPSQVEGNILFMHCVNTSGFWTRTVEILPEDGYNLNRDYPGRADGTTGERIAYYFMTELFPRVDFIFDFHSGANTEIMTPLVFYTNAPEVKEQAYEAAKALDLPYLVESRATKGEYSYAAHNYRVPGLLVEIGHSHSCQQEWVQLYYRNLKLLLQHLGICQFGEGKELKSQRVYKEAIYLDASEQGLWYPAVTVRQKVKKGDLLGHMEDFFGNPKKHYYAQADGRILYYTDALAVPKDSFLAAYGLEETAELLE